MQFPTVSLLVSGVFLLMTTLAQSAHPDKRKYHPNPRAQEQPCRTWVEIAPPGLPSVLPQPFGQACVVEEKLTNNSGQAATSTHTWTVATVEGQQLQISQTQLAAKTQQPAEGLVFVQDAPKVMEPSGTPLSSNREAQLCKRAQNRVVCIRSASLTKHQSSEYLEQVL